MTKILIIAKAEWCYWLRSKVAISIFNIGLLLIISSVITTAMNTFESTQARLALQSSAENAFVEQPDRHPHRMVHYGHYVFRTPALLSALDPGVDTYIGNAIFLEGHRQNSAMFSNQREGTALTQLGSLTPAFIVQVLVPLLLILIGYSTITREKEANTLTFLLSQGISGVTLLTGKVLALMSVAVLLILPLIISNMFIFYLGESLLVTLGFIFGYVVYLSVWTLLITIASCVLAKNSASLSALILLWIVICLIMPKIANTTATSVIPSVGKLQTDFSVLSELAKLGDGHNAADPAFNQLKLSLLAKYNVKSIDDLPVNFKGVVASASEAELSEVLNRFAQQRMQVELSQVEISRAFGWLSPMMAIHSLSMIIAGTSIETHHQFLQEAEKFRFSFVQGLNQVHIDELTYHDDLNRNKDASASKKARVNSENWQLLEAFHFHIDNANTRIKRSLFAFLQLCIWLIVLIITIKISGKRL